MRDAVVKHSYADCLAVRENS